ncbi:MAG: hypothetical protein P4L84_13655 [Isosphaeraceae bacterium]|nr:hypothetical protein [Isosphaeraceae bacterium]
MPILSRVYRKSRVSVNDVPGYTGTARTLDFAKLGQALFDMRTSD